MAYSSDTFNALDLEVKKNTNINVCHLKTYSLLIGINNDLEFLKIGTLRGFPCIKSLNIKCNSNIHSNITPFIAPQRNYQWKIYSEYCSCFLS